MSDVTSQIETMANRYMRAWVLRDLPELKTYTGRGFQLLIGSKPAVILDRASWLEAGTKRLLCDAYRFGDIYVRDLGPVALFATQVELKATLDGRDWSGWFWITDVWRKGKIRRRWRLVQRVLSRVEDDAKVAAAIKPMQLWR